MDFIRRYRWPIAIGASIVLVVGFLLFRPDKLFVDDVVDESLADAFGAPATEIDTTTAAPETTAGTTPTTTEPPSGASSAPPETTTTAGPTTTTPSGPISLTTGAFYGIDHRAEGTATVYEQDGRFVLRFEDDTDIQNGPDLFVWVLEAEDYDGGTPGAFIDLGKIKGNVGGQNYELPGEFDPELHRFVLIWCKRFAVPFAAAPLGSST